MNRNAPKPAFSLIEVLVAVALIAVLIGLVLGVGKQIKTQAEERLAKSQIDIIVAAIQQYYDFHEAFPPALAADADLELEMDGLIDSGSPTDRDGYPFANCEGLYYYLAGVSNSRRLIDTISSTLTTSNDQAGIVRRITLNTNPPKSVSIMRFVDPWAKTLRYVYAPPMSFPRIDSAGADEVFGTDDDITSE